MNTNEHEWTGGFLGERGIGANPWGGAAYGRWEVLLWQIGAG